MEFRNKTRQLRAKLIIFCTLMANKCMTKAFKCECKRECMERTHSVLLEHLALNMNILSEYIHILSIFLFLCAVFFRVALFIFLLFTIFTTMLSQLGSKIVWKYAWSSYRQM